MTPIREVAEAYIKEGWAVVPLVPGEKKANTKWQSKIYMPDDFPADAGIAGKCGEPSGDRVDVDLDHPYAVLVAPFFLPDTQLIHGRPGKPDSHWWYVCEGIKTRQYTGLKQADGAKAMLVEIRASGYTALPPSGHPSGDVLAWTIEREATRLMQDELLAPVNYVAIATLAAIHYPEHGARHEMVGHLAGFLLKCGVPPIVVPRVVEAAAAAARDSDIRDRINFARETVKKYQQDAEAVLTGGPKLAESLGKDVVAKMRSWLGVADDDAIEEMNRKHFWVRIGRDDVIGREDTRDGLVIFQRPQALRSEYANVQIKVGENVNRKTGETTDQLKDLFDAWLGHPSRRSYREVVFLPPPHVCDPRDYNLWKGFAVEPTDGDCALFLRHIYEVICGERPDVYDYLMDHCASMVQAPGTPAEVAVMLRGDQGTGKGRFVRTLIDIFGRRHAIQLDNVKHLVGGFNAAISGKILVFADEAFWAGNKASVGALKRLITEPTLAIERKGIDVIEEPNFVHLFMATNEDWAIPAGLDERRFLALKVSSRYKLRAGGVGAFLQVLLNRKITSDLRRVPKTDELRNQQERSLSPLLEWWHDCLYEGALPNPYLVGWPNGEWVPMRPLYQSYKEWAESRKQYPLSNVKFALDIKGFAFVSDITPKNVKRDLQTTTKEVVRCGLLKPLDEARKYFDSRLGTQTTWPEVDVTQPELL
jgi:hypothetical protein